jgi:hypothetical protein
MAEGQSVENHTESSPNAPNLGKVTAIQRPDYVPEKFYDTKTGVIDFEGIAKSYGELERKQSAPAPKADDAGAPDPTKAPAPEPTPKSVDLPVVPGVTPDQMKVFSAELVTTGKLSDESYAALLKSGFNKPAVDAYVKGLTADATAAQAVSEARVADDQIKSITDSIGGKAALKEMQDWAVASLSDKDLAAYNAAVSGSDPAKVKLAVHGLHAQFTKANGTEERLFSGSNNVADAQDVFQSRAEQSRAINDPLYKTDSAYRQKVEAKIGRSNL